MLLECHCLVVVCWLCVHLVLFANSGWYHECLRGRWWVYKEGDEYDEPWDSYEESEDYIGQEQVQEALLLMPGKPSIHAYPWIPFLLLALFYKFNYYLCYHFSSILWYRWEIPSPYQSHTNPQILPMYPPRTMTSSHALESSHRTYLNTIWSYPIWMKSWILGRHLCPKYGWWESC